MNSLSPLQYINVQHWQGDAEGMKKQKLPINENTNFNIILNQHNPSRERDAHFFITLKKSKKDRKVGVRLANKNKDGEDEDEDDAPDSPPEKAPPPSKAPEPVAVPVAIAPKAAPVAPAMAAPTLSAQALVRHHELFFFLNSNVSFPFASFFL